MSKDVDDRCSTRSVRLLSCEEHRNTDATKNEEESIFRRVVSAHAGVTGSIAVTDVTFAMNFAIVRLL